MGLTFANIGGVRRGKAAFSLQRRSQTQEETDEIQERRSS